YLVRLSRGEEALDRQADELYDTLQKAGIEALYDDRDLAPGVKFNDADLMGIPLRATISARSLQNGGIELKRRDGSEARIVPVDGVVEAIRAELAAMQEQMDARVEDIPYPDEGE